MAVLIAKDPLTGDTPAPIQAVNASASVSIDAGMMVYISGYDYATGKIKVSLADADLAGGAAQFIAAVQIGTSAQGIVYRHALVGGIDTSAGAVGDPVYLSTTAGTATLSAPSTAASTIQVVGRVVTVGVTGTVFFHPATSFYTAVGSSAIQTGAVTSTGITALSVTTGTINSLAVTTAKIAANAVTAAKLTATLGTGQLVFPLELARAIASNEFGVIAVGGAGTVGSGGILGSDGSTAPKLIRRSTSTDPTADINWPAAVVTEIQWNFVVPNDMDVTAASTINCLASMGGATNTPTLTVKCFTGVGGSNLGGATGALAAAEAAVSVSILANSFTNNQAGMVSLVPGTHGTDAVRLRACYLLYTRK